MGDCPRHLDQLAGPAFLGRDSRAVLRSDSLYRKNRDVACVIRSRKLAALCLLPQCVELLESGVGNTDPSLARHFLHLPKAPLELRVRFVQRNGRMDAGLSAK